jgi:hypothetical protein
VGFAFYDAGRYFAMSGCRLETSGMIVDATAELTALHAELFPRTSSTTNRRAKIETNLSDNELIDRARKANINFERLCAGQWEERYSSQSEADVALCMYLGFWTGRDATRMDSLFRQSGLYRQKWERKTYREQTITWAIEHTRNVYTPPWSPPLEPDDGPKTPLDEKLRDEHEHEPSPPEPDEEQKPPRDEHHLWQQSEHRISAIEQVPLMRDCGSESIHYLEEPLLVEGAVAALTGAPGSGKSSLVCAIARRLHQFGRPVLILDRENPKVVIEDRFRRLDMTDDETFHVWGGWLDEEAPQLASPIVLDWVRRCSPTPLIIIDSMRPFNGGDENSASDTRTFLNQARKVANLGATPWVLHHDGKSETAKDYRGSSDFPAAIDIGFHVTNMSNDGRLDKLLCRSFKHRFGFGGEVIYNYTDGKFIREDAANVRQSIDEQLVVILRTNPGICAKEFEKLAAARNGIVRNQARTFLKKGKPGGHSPNRDRPP